MKEQTVVLKINHNQTDGFHYSIDESHIVIVPVELKDTFVDSFNQKVLDIEDYNRQCQAIIDKANKKYHQKPFKNDAEKYNAMIKMIDAEKEAKMIVVNHEKLIDEVVEEMGIKHLQVYDIINVDLDTNMLDT